MSGTARRSLESKGRQDLMQSTAVLSQGKPRNHGYELLLQFNKRPILNDSIGDHYHGNIPRHIKLRFRVNRRYLVAGSS